MSDASDGAHRPSGPLIDDRCAGGLPRTCCESESTQEVVARLRALVKETEARYASSRHRSAMETTRLADQRFDHELTTPHGAIPLYRMELPLLTLPLEIPPALAAAWGVESTCPRAMALDIETAATVGGDREVPFVIGMAWQDEGALVLQQLVLRGMEDESAALWALKGRLVESSHLLTYNGSRFDLPLVARRSRAVLREAFEPPCDVVDLEPFARAVFGADGLSSRLADLEERALFVVRPAWTWHPVWQECSGLSWRRRRHLARVLSKNGQDTLSLLLLFRAVHEMVADECDDPRAACFIARALEPADPGEAARWFERAAEGPLDAVRLRAALGAWRLRESSRDRLTDVLARGVSSELPDAWRAAEQLGLRAWRLGNMEDAVRWTGEALRHHPPASTKSRMCVRLNRWTARPAK